ncbi:hypothetical protein BBBOND_0212320 [Babesia bigemina]|uniref:Uncharacterized protein n=1 Tax=Babesia bigemina TaxID=5866 RepID=A0A061DDA0_BABBI|nr:hypothetical protein BBBOND_0212320 [Babesia bigemina]CDR96090.1 hypothetical protein BBBOND_0212320 [Babesia bigemina]|eukprot:XP_012768276.1 hypothetical protein BBBOND_0212320 [Babesia bigemina]
MRGLGAAVVVLQLVEGSGRGSGTCCSRLRGVGAAVVEGTGSGSGSVAVEGTGSGSGEGEGKMATYYKCECGTNCRYPNCYCCPWCCDKCNASWTCSGCWLHYNKRTSGLWTYDCETQKCAKQCKNKEYQCKCTCCRGKQERGEAVRPPAPQPPLTSSGAQDHATSERQQSGLSDLQPPTDDLHEQASTPFRPDPQAIAAVIVAIIVAIILLDLCIFRFPVGRNIRDFIVRKIPFCIAFYS